MATIHATDETFDSLVAEGVVLVDFTAVWCGPCKLLAKVLEELEDELPFVSIVKVDIDQCPGLVRRFEIDAVPQVFYFKDGEVADHGIGAASGDEIRAELAELLY